jgi:hypothetical protein
LSPTLNRFETSVLKWKDKDKNLEGVGSLERDKPTALLINTLGHRHFLHFGDLNEKCVRGDYALA